MSLRTNLLHIAAILRFERLSTREQYFTIYPHACRSCGGRIFEEVIIPAENEPGGSVMMIERTEFRCSTCLSFWQHTPATSYVLPLDAGLVTRYQVVSPYLAIETNYDFPAETANKLPPLFLTIPGETDIPDSHGASIAKVVTILQSGGPSTLRDFLTIFPDACSRCGGRLSSLADFCRDSTGVVVELEHDQEVCTRCNAALSSHTHRLTLYKSGLYRVYSPFLPNNIADIFPDPPWDGYQT